MKYKVLITFRSDLFLCPRGDASQIVQTEKPTLWFDDVQQRLGPCAGCCSQRSDAALCRIHHSLQQRQALLGAGVGPGHGLTGGTDQREVAHTGNNILGHNRDTEN